MNQGLVVGGPAICGGADHWIEDFLNFCDRESVPVDFVSRHAYTSKPPYRTPHMMYQEMEPITYMLEEFKVVREMIKKSPLPELPFHITEYNSSYHPQNPVHDTPFNAAYITRILSEGGDYVDSFSYWTFSDVFGETDIPRSQFHGGFGLMTLNNIKKPTYHMFSFFSTLGEERLYRDEHIIVTRRRDGSLALIAWNEAMKKEGPHEREYELMLPVEFNDIFIKEQLIDEDYGNPWVVWKRMGRPRYPDKDALKTLRQAAEPRLITTRSASENGYVKLKFTLGKNAVALFELKNIKDESHTYLGLDDSKITSY